MKTTIIPRQQRAIVYENKGADLPVYYANNSETQVSNLDVRFRFGQIQDVENDDVHVRNVFTLYMSLEHAKTFSEQLTALIQQLDEALAGPKQAE